MTITARDCLTLAVMAVFLVFPVRILLFHGCMEKGCAVRIVISLAAGFTCERYIRPFIHTTIANAISVKITAVEIKIRMSDPTILAGIKLIVLPTFSNC